MKVLLVNGSPNPAGNTCAALEEMGCVFQGEGVDFEIFQLGAGPVNDCIGCMKCRTLENRCVLKGDCVNELIEKAQQADGFVFGTPVYYAHPSGRILSVLDRAFFAGKPVFARKPGAAVTTLRRGGATASFDVLNKYFTVSEMPIVSANYWNMAHRKLQGQEKTDSEGFVTLRNLARNMTWLLRCLEAGRQLGINPPENEKGISTDFCS